MSQAVVIDGFAFARAGSSIAGSLALQDLPRLAESGSRGAALTFTVRGDESARGMACLVVTVSGTIELTCQRCLAPLTVPADVESELELSASEVEIATADDEIDRVFATEAMDVVALVEDEILLALPMAPKHEACGLEVGAGDGAEDSPFARLAALRKDR